MFRPRMQARLAHRLQVFFEIPHDFPDGIRLFVGNRDTECRNERTLQGVSGTDDAARDTGRAKQDAYAQLRAAEPALDRYFRDVGDGFDVPRESRARVVLVRARASSGAKVLSFVHVPKRRPRKSGE